MKQTSIDALKTAFVQMSAELVSHPLGTEDFWQHHRGPSGWQGKVIQRPSWRTIHLTNREAHDRICETLGSVLGADYPDHMRRFGTASSNGVLQPHMILGSLVTAGYERFGSFVLDDAQIDALTAEAVAFFDKPTASLRLLAPVLNMRGPPNVPPVSFPGDYVLRPITDEEFTAIYGGSPLFQYRGFPLRAPEFVFVHDLEIAKVVGGSFEERLADPISKSAEMALDRCMLALSSFKHSGPVGYDGIRVEARELAFGIGFGGLTTFPPEHIPYSDYPLSPEEVPQLQAHAARFEDIHSALAMACQRLLDASRRLRPRDAILDAAIGLESILLNEIGEPQRGENRFRFSINYASLVPTPDRFEAYRTARSLYDLRSTIAHGTEPGGRCKFAGKEMGIDEVSQLARRMLHGTVSRFMQNGAAPDFINEGYWTKRVLGLPEPALKRER